ncbi:MAG TPA: hypothetical protein VK971_04750 [Thiohalobacter sp.]|nr:hypothetical protein [Thiohalobacter sp.]
MSSSTLITIRSARCRPAQILAGLALAAVSVLPLAAAEAPVLHTDQTVATAGDFRLSWQDGDGAVYELQQVGPQGFAATGTEYRGPDTATQLSGLPDGDYVYRVRVVEPSPSPWSEPVTVEVRHHPLSRAFGFFTVGLIVFLATVILIMRGARAD